MKKSWRRLEDVFRLRLHKTSWRRLQVVLIKANMFALSLTSSEDVFKTSSRCVGQDQYIRLGHTSSRLLQDVLKTSSKRLQDIFKTSYEDVFKTSTKCLQDLMRNRQVKVFLLTRLWEAFKTFLRSSFPNAIICSGISLGKTISDRFMVSVQTLQER